MNNVLSQAAELSKKPQGQGLAERKKSGVKGMFDRKQRRPQTQGQPAPLAEVGKQDPKARSKQDEEAVARAVLEALNTLDPL